jgi:DNA-binding protein HU-beta
MGQSVVHYAKKLFTKRVGSTIFISVTVIGLARSCQGELPSQQKGGMTMSLSKSQTVGILAERTGLAKVQVGDLLDELAKLAYAEAKDGFVLPGLGKLVLVHRQPRIGRNPATGESIEIPAKTVVKFRVAKVCKDSVLAV